MCIFQLAGHVTVLRIIEFPYLGQEVNLYDEGL